MKKLLSLLLAALAAFCFVGCAELPIDITPSDNSDNSVYSEITTTSSQTQSEKTAKTEPVQTDSTPPAQPPQTTEEIIPTEEQTENLPNAPPEDGFYSSRDEVALYIHVYGKLPQNFITKAKAREYGWEGGSVEKYTQEGYCIGGDRFGNYEGLLPEKDGRKYTECDIDTVGKSSRGAKRIIFSNDGLIYYTDNHYKTFTLLYGEE